jgi:peroxidase
MFRDRIYNETNIDPGFFMYQRHSCPSNNAGNTNLAPLDPATSNVLDNRYYKNLMQRRRLLHYQVLFNGSATDGIVASYRNDQSSFYVDFAAATVKMGDFNPLTGTSGQIRKICSAIY